MKVTVLIFRFFGLILFGTAGFYLVNQVVPLFFPTIAVLPYAIGSSVDLAAVGFLIMPAITLNPINWVRSYLSKVSGPTLIFALIGLVVGLIIAALISLPISFLPKPFSSVLPFVAAVLFGYLGAAIAVSRQGDLRDVFQIGHRGPKGSHVTTGKWQQDKSILIDTSVIIDGRIVDIARTGFIAGTLVIPRFVLNELQYIADSAESLRRQRGRRGMEVLSDLQKERAITTTIADIDVEGVREVDEKLIMLARQMKAPILTNDYNLNRVAELQGVQVLNINELANAVKSILLPGEILTVNVIQEGKETGQGVAYLDDGTMVVVEDGRNYIGKEIEVSVTKVLQTAAGRMIFSKPGVRSGNGNGNNKK
ncbi:MAG: PIN domain-containing protein [Anaerolineaceae bacterium]|nr:PIN domain-containing protein [Anaerolineaceae bacterium]